MLLVKKVDFSNREFESQLVKSFKVYMCILKWQCRTHSQSLITTSRYIISDFYKNLDAPMIRLFPIFAHSDTAVQCKLISTFNVSTCNYSGIIIDNNNYWHSLTKECAIFLS